MRRTIPLGQVIRELADDHPADAVAQRRCLRSPIGCGRTLALSQPFRDRPSFEEWRITGLCQECQDRMESA